MKVTKGKIIIAIMLTIAMLILSVKDSMAYADNIKVDEKEDIIVMPNTIFDGSGSILIDSSVKNYKLYYQGVDMSEEIYKKCTNLEEEYKLKELKDKVNETQKKLINAAEEDKDECRKEFENAKKEYESSINNYNSALKTLIPDYKDDKWKESTDGRSVDNLFSSDSNAGGIALWVKLVKSDGTNVYNVKIYGVNNKNDNEDEKNAVITNGDEKKDVITLDKTTLSLEEGNSATLTATINSTDITDKTVTWKSEDEKIAKVENGKVTAISEGTTKIIATASDGSTATCTVTVKKVASANEEKPNDQTTSKKPLAQTGEKTYIVIAILAIASVFGLYRFKKEKNLKLK